MLGSYFLRCVTTSAALWVVSGCEVVEAQPIGNLLPSATGPHAVGRVTYHWVDSSRTDAFSPLQGAPREVLVDVWYPTGASDHEPSSYLPELAILRRVMPDSILRRRFAPAYAAIAAGLLWSNAAADAPTRCDPPGCPVLVFSPGGGVDRSFYTSQYEDLASHGYVVATVVHPYSAPIVLFPDGRTVRAATAPPDSIGPDRTLPVWRQILAREARAIAFQRRHSETAAADISFVLDQLTLYSQ